MFGIVRGHTNQNWPEVDVAWENGTVESWPAGDLKVLR